MLRPSILILLVLQISAVFCRSTANYEDGATETGTGAVNFNETLKDNKEFLNQSAVGQGTVLHGDSYYNRRNAVDQYIVLMVAGISVSIFVFGSLILGCILYFCCRMKPRPGYIVRQANVSQAGEVQQQPGSIAMQTLSSDQGNLQQYPSTTQPMRQPPTNPHHPLHQQNLYPAIPPSHQ